MTLAKKLSPVGFVDVYGKFVKTPFVKSFGATESSSKSLQYPLKWNVPEIVLFVVFIEVMTTDPVSKSSSVGWLAIKPYSLPAGE
ncbi:hypothetical protein D3C80_1647480 [compost metagenome]